ncbi:MAG: thioredoxin family protein [Smithellaceae bacterium]|jgi:thioredoxin 1|nr:thioredoxin family protein [Smithellaceae bacterium]HCS77735.1 thioredoxin [Syntrophaceae bacterium]
MELRLKFMGILVFLIVFTFAFSSLPCSQVFAQDKIGKSAAQRPSVFKPLVTFVEIGAARCIPCKAMQPIMKEVAEEYRGQVRVLFHDVWTPQGRMDAEKYNIRVIPTQVFLDKDDKEYFRHEGYFPKDGVVKVIKMQGIK